MRASGDAGIGRRRSPGAPRRRLAGAWLIDPAVELRFRFDGHRYTGHPGDTLASALLANGVDVVGRSFKYHRPRGIVGAGVEEPNAIVQVGEGALAVPGLKATEVPLTDGLVAHSERGWPSAGHDALGLLDSCGRFMPAGFYYKTFMRPRRLWPMFERVIRRAASGATLPERVLPHPHETCHRHCELLVIGAGPAGLTAALAGARSGKRVILVEQSPHLGGCLLDHPIDVDGQPATGWVEAVGAELADAGDVTVLTRTTVHGRYGGGRFGAVELLDDPLGAQRSWNIQAGAAIAATGAIERPLVFANNDRPGVMLASAASAYIRRYGVVPGRRVVVATNNDSAYATAAALEAAGAAVTVVDARVEPDSAVAAGVEVITGSHVVGGKGRRRVGGVVIAGPAGMLEERDADLVCVSGGWTPTVHLAAHRGDPLRYDAGWGASVPDGAVQGFTTAGAAAGVAGLQAVLQHGADIAHRVIGGAVTQTGVPAVTADPLGSVSVDAAWSRPPCPTATGKAFVDLQTDVTVGDIETSVDEGFTGLQHVKRYTTLGMGTDQGKTGNVVAAEELARATGRSVAEVGATTFRPPYTPVTLGAMAGPAVGRHLAPVRRTPIHQWHEQHGAVFMPSALWLRPRAYPGSGREDEVVEASVVEARNVRGRVGIADVSTLGKIDLQGPDTATLLDRVYTNRFSNLAVGKARYGVMLRDDGYVFDDGTTARIGEQHYVMSTTTGNAGDVLAHLELYHQTCWPELDVSMTSVTDQWAQVAVAGPRSRDLLERLLDDTGVDVSDAALPRMGVVEVDLDGRPVRLFRLSFSGERAYEVAVPADHGAELWELLLDRGESLGVMPYGLEAMEHLRIEKGHLIVGAEIDGRVSPFDVGLGGLCRMEKDFIGRRSLAKPVFAEPDRQQVAGLISADGRTPIPAGAQLTSGPLDGTPRASLGRVTSSGFGVSLDSPIGLGLLVGGADRYDEPLHAVSPVTGSSAAVRVVEPCMYDPSGERTKG